MEVVLFETNKYKEGAVFVNELIRQNLSSAVVIAMMTNNPDVYADFQNDNNGRAHLNLSWQPLIYTELDNSRFELYKRSIIGINEITNNAINAFEYAASSSPYEITIPVFTPGFVNDPRINSNIINDIKKVTILRGSEVHALLVPKSLAQWFFGQYRLEQTRLISSFLEGLAKADSITKFQDYVEKNSAGVATGDKTFRKLARLYGNVDIIQLDGKPTEILSYFVKHLQASRVNRPSFLFYILLILIMVVVVYFLTRRRNMFR